MDFETQVLDTLTILNEKIDAVLQWKAGQEPRCRYHKEQITAIKAKIYGNGNKGIERRLDSVEDVARTIRKLWIAMFIAGMVALMSFISQLYQKADNTHGNNEEIHVTNPVQ